MIKLKICSNFTANKRTIVIYFMNIELIGEVNYGFLFTSTNKK